MDTRAIGTWLAAQRGVVNAWIHFGTLSLSLGGSQVVWSLELAYGTPYLLSIGLSKAATGYVWIAGPLSGLVMQPLLGSLSDSSASRFRRRKYMAASALAVFLSTCLISFSQPLAAIALDVVGSGLGDWDPVRAQHVRYMTQVLSVVGFWILDFAVNGLQVIARALILDHADAHEQNEASAWQGRMLHAGNIFGYWCGWYNLASVPWLRWLGGGQFRKFAMVSSVCMLVCVAATCLFSPETPRAPPEGSEGLLTRLRGSVRQVWRVGSTLPRAIRRVCLVQLFATMSWFPFLFYGTTYVLDSGRAHRRDPYAEREEEKGSLAMLLFALVALCAGLVLPACSLAGRLDGDAGASHRSSVASDAHWPAADAAQHSHADASPRGRLCRAQCVSLRAMWCLGALTHAALLTLGTFLVRTQRDAMLLIALMGVPWAVWTWVPFALVGEFVREAEMGAGTGGDNHWSAQRFMDPHDMRQRLSGMDFDYGSRHHSSATLDAPSLAPSTSGSVQRAMSGSYTSIVSRGRQIARRTDGALVEDSARGGTILGIHNLAVVVPQFAVAIISALIFRATSTQPADAPRGSPPQHASDGNVAWVLRFGGVMALLAALLCRIIPLTMTERSTRRPTSAVRLQDDDEEQDDDEDDLHPHADDAHA
ncbi:hypothetical protein MSPP1_002204 [Malassezia sp. CBS 17886]|nr:hypothetical protein MSPP1_002204 [Malassezia sp. CBS 17886]